MDQELQRNRRKSRLAIVRLGLITLLVVGTLGIRIWMVRSGTTTDSTAEIGLPVDTTLASQAETKQKSASLPATLPATALLPMQPESLATAADQAAATMTGMRPGGIASGGTASRPDSSDLALHSTRLIVPVAGIRPDQLTDTYDDARSAGRVHDAIDIMAPQGTPVVAAANGTIVKFFQSKLGGTTIYQLDNDQTTVYYYAHLQRYADGLVEGTRVRQGDTIAYVGDTGDAGPGNYHLHFGITLVSDPTHYWGGTDVNPYPLLGGK